MEDQRYSYRDAHTNACYAYTHSFGYTCHAHAYRDIDTCYPNPNNHSYDNAGRYTNIHSRPDAYTYSRRYTYPHTLRYTDSSGAGPQPLDAYASPGR